MSRLAASARDNISVPAWPVSAWPVSASQVPPAMAPSVAFAAAAPLRAAHSRPAPLRHALAPMRAPASELGPVRAALARPPGEDGVRYVGTPPTARRGRLRVDLRRPATSAPAPPPATAGRYGWGRGRYSRVGRASAIWAFIGVLVARNYVDSRRVSYFLFDKTEEKVRARRRRLAAWAREEILKLGPTMIKVGQLAAARADIFPAEVTEELLQLTDKVPAFEWDEARVILEEAYGRPVGDVFLWFDKTPLAAASLGQVHRAALPDGTEVVVKLQRPGLKALFDFDLEALRNVAEYLQKSKKYGGETRDWVGIYEECRTTLYEEIDYELEAASSERFRANFADIPYVIIPKVYPEFSTKNVLCLQYVPGVSVRDREGLEAVGADPKVVANRISEVLLKSILDHSFFSADPHPGNCAVVAGGGLVLYDFGMMGSLSPRIKEQLVDILLGVIEKDAELVMNTLVDLGALVLPADPQPVRRAIQFFLDSVGSRPDRDQTVTAIGDDLYATAQDKPFRLPAASIFLLRALSTTEGVCKSLDPEFSFAAVSKPYGDELLRGRKVGPGQETSGPGAIVRSLADAAITGKPDILTQQLQKSIIGAGSNAISAVNRIESMEATIAKIERGDLKVRTSRGFEQERLLEKLRTAQQAQNYLVVTAASSVLSGQLYSSGQPIEATGAAAAVAAIAGVLYFQKSAKANRDPFKKRT